MPVTISTSTLAAATGYSNQKKRVRLSTGKRVAVLAVSTGAEFYHSDDGATWTAYASNPIAGWVNGSIAAYVDSGGTERLIAVWKQSGTGGGRTDDRTYVMVGAFNADRTTLTWGTAVVVHNFVGFDYPDVVAHAEGTGGYAHIVASYNDATPFNSAYRASCSIDSSGVVTSPGYTAFTGAGYGANVPTFPSIDIDPDTKRLLVAWTAGTAGAGNGIRFRTASYSAGTWAWASEVEVSSSYYVHLTTIGIVCQWDGTRAVIGAMVTNGVDYFIQVWDSTDLATFSDRVNENIGSTQASFLYGFGMAIDENTGDVWLFGSQWDGSAYSDVVYRKATRSGSTLSLGSRVAVETFTGAGTPPYVNASYAEQRLDLIWRASSSSPYNVRAEEISVAQAGTRMLLTT